MNSAEIYINLLRQEFIKRGINPPKYAGVPFNVGKMYREDMLKDIKRTYFAK